MIDLFRPFMHESAQRAVAATLAPDINGRIYIGEGPRVAEFERSFGEFVRQTNPLPLAVNSCTTALEMALYLAGVRMGSEVISTPMTCTATNGAIARLGARIVWADVEHDTGLISHASVRSRLTARTRAVMAVDWAGRSCNYNSLADFGIPVIQDAAHHLMVDPKNHGTYVCWSFQAIKHLTTGDGGALLVPASQYDRARKYRWYGLDRLSGADFRCAQDITEVGIKGHMNDIAASIGLANLPYMHNVVARHRNNADWYHRALKDLPGVTLPMPDPDSSWWLYCLLVPDRDSFISFMAEHGIAASPVHARNDKHTAFRYPTGPLPGVDAFAAREVAIPVGWWLTEADRERVAAACWEWAVAYANRELVTAA